MQYPSSGACVLAISSSHVKSEIIARQTLADLPTPSLPQVAQP